MNLGLLMGELSHYVIAENLDEAHRSLVRSMVLHLLIDALVYRGLSHGHLLK